MPEILTESFCERCGTRYTFESAAPRANKLKGVKVLSRGLKNFVMSDDTSLDEAMAAARSDTDREVTSQQLDAFHKTFNFCMQCRQYTCANCWNEADGRCLTCAPHLGHDILEAPFPDLAASPLDLRADTNGNGPNGHRDPGVEALAWPTSDLLREEHIDGGAIDEIDSFDAGPDIEPIDAAARLDALGAGPSAPPEPAASDDGEQSSAGAQPPGDAAPQEFAAAAQAPRIDMVPDGDASDIDRRAVAATAATASLLRSFRPGQSLDAALEAYEREQAGEPAAAATEPPAATEPVAAAEPAALAAPPPAEDTPIDRVEQPTWRIVAPDGAPGQVDPAAAPAAAPAPPVAAGAEPQWPAQPEWPSHTSSSAGLPFLGRPAAATGGIEALWAESAREVASVPTSGPSALPTGGATRTVGGVQPCVSCGLSLSATARFCRRCGSRQG